MLEDTEFCRDLELLDGYDIPIVTNIARMQFTAEGIRQPCVFLFQLFVKFVWFILTYLRNLPGKFDLTAARHVSEPVDTLRQQLVTIESQSIPTLAEIQLSQSIQHCRRFPKPVHVSFPGSHLLDYKVFIPSPHLLETTQDREAPRKHVRFKVGTKEKYMLHVLKEDNNKVVNAKEMEIVRKDGE